MIRSLTELPTDRPTDVTAQANRHPCYGEDAQHQFARMHLPVAPKCNISCNYCHRKYDCANESRPGVTSSVLKPCDAVKKAVDIAEKMPQLAVVGIAGPGDPLANPERTFETFRGTAEALPDVHLCLSTNGLTLMDHIDEVVATGISHLTITINAIDAEVGQHIYSRVFWKGVTYKGRRAAELLISRQLEGLQAAAAAGIKCKVNTVLIPGINDTHVPKVSAMVRKLGAVLHNVMPYIPVPGSLFEKMGLTPPSEEMLKHVRRLCGEEMPVMTHCRQCRADAVGMLSDTDKEREALAAQSAKPVSSCGSASKCGSKKESAAASEDQPQALSPASSAKLKPGTILAAICTEGGQTVNRHFGHAREFHIFELTGGEAKLKEIRLTEPYCNGRSDCEPDKAEPMAIIIKLLSDCSLLFSSGIGDAPGKELQAAGIVPVMVKRGTPIQALTEEYARFASFFNGSERIS